MPKLICSYCKDPILKFQKKKSFHEGCFDAATQSGELSAKSLWKVNDCVKNKTFLARLGKWVVKHYGNVNVAQRLNTMAILDK